MKNLHQPRVSVVIPAYNSSRYVGAAIESVLAQTLPVHECIVVNDGSTDETPAIARSFGSRVTVISTENQGVSAARNVGIDASEGDLIAFLDADDIWLPEKLEHQIPLFDEPGVGLVYCGLHLIDQDGRFVGRVGPPPRELALWNTLLLEGPPMSVAQTGVVAREAVRQLGGFDPQFSTSADCEFASRIACRYEVRAVDRPLVLYRSHPGQMHRDPVTTLEDMKSVYRKLLNDERVPARVRRGRRRGMANLYISIAGKYRLAGRRGLFLLWLVRAAVMRPDRVLAAAARFMDSR